MIRGYVLRKPRTIPDKEHQCEHQWTKYRKTVLADNMKFNYQFSFYFRVRACGQCKTIEYLDLVKE